MPTDRRRSAPADLADQLAKVWPSSVWRGVNVVVAISGGADSVALARSVAANRLSASPSEVFLAHFNHRWRGEESDADEAWVRQFADSLGMPILIDRRRKGIKASSEESARDLRYRFLTESAEQVGARYVATGHTLDDQVETVLLRILRGAGLAGLAGIPQRRALSESVTVVRPLLHVSREEVLQYLQSLSQDFRVDATNSDERHLRNRVRKTLLPLLRDEFDEGVDQAIERLRLQATEAQRVVEQQARRIVHTGVKIAEGAPSPFIALRLDSFSGIEALIVREACKLAWRQAGWSEQAMTARHWMAIQNLLEVGPSAPDINLPTDVVAGWREGDVVLRRKEFRPAKESLNP